MACAIRLLRGRELTYGEPLPLHRIKERNRSLQH
jgi:hypothetical protein